MYVLRLSSKQHEVESSLETIEQLQERQKQLEGVIDTLRIELKSHQVRRFAPCLTHRLQAITQECQDSVRTLLQEKQALVQQVLKLKNEKVQRPPSDLLHVTTVAGFGNE